MMRFKLTYKHKKRLALIAFVKIFKRKIVYAVCSVALKIYLASAFVKNISVIAVRGKFKAVCRAPVLIFALPFARNCRFFTVHSRRACRIGGKMPFAYVCRLIARFVKVMRKRSYISRKRNTVFVAAYFGCINSRLQAGSCRSANRLAGVVVFKYNALPCKLA